jgi:hypothetical protein
VIVGYDQTDDQAPMPTFHVFSPFVFKPIAKFPAESEAKRDSKTTPRLRATLRTTPNSGRYPVTEKDERTS